MRLLMRSSAVFAALPMLVLACTGKTVPEIGAPDTSATEPTPSGGSTPPETTETEGETTPPPETPKGICATTRTYFESCGNADELTCGASFDAWCALNDKLNSDALRRAEAACLTTQNCDGTARRACEYGYYANEKMTASQKALVTAYCNTCDPDEFERCLKRSTKFDKSRGIESVPDVFIAAWELADPIVDQIKKACTGEALGQSRPDSSSCSEAFANCAADIYIARLPDCPK